MSHLHQSGLPTLLLQGPKRWEEHCFPSQGEQKPAQSKVLWGDKLGTVSQMGTLEWVKPALKRAAPFSSHCVTLHTSIQAELRALLAEIQKGQNHSFILPHTCLCIPCLCIRVHTVQHGLTNSTHTHSQAQDCSLLVTSSGYITQKAEEVSGFCPDVVIISLMLTQMSMGSGDKGFLIPHMNLAPKGRVCGKYGGSCMRGHTLHTACPWP